MSDRPGPDHRGKVSPLTGSAGWLLVDGKAACAVCGRPAEPVTPDRWRHAAAGAPPLHRSPWLVPVTPDDVAAVSSYEEFGERHPWAVRADFGCTTVTTPVDWRRGADRLTRYAERLGDVETRGEITGNPLLELHRILLGPAAGDEAPPSPGVVQMLDLPERRRELAALLAWAVPTGEALDTLGHYAPLVEGGAGTGYWTAMLRARGVDVVAYDLHPPGPGGGNEFHATDHPPWTEVGAVATIAAVRRHPARTLLLCWPSPDDDAGGYRALGSYRGDVMVHVGDPAAGSGTVRLHRELARNWSVVEEVALPRWPKIADRVTVHRRNPERRPLTERDRCYQCGRFLVTGAIGRCDICFRLRPPALALRVGPHRVEYPLAALAVMPDALRWALLDSPNRIA